jgi:hypothetical protein
MPTSIEIRAEAAALEQTLPALQAAFAKASLSALGAPTEPALQETAEASLASLRATEAKLDMLRAAIPEAVRIEAEQMAAAEAAERQRQREKLVAKQGKLLAERDKEAEYVDEKTTAYNEAIDARDQARRQYNLAVLQIGVHQENITSAERRMTRLEDEWGDLQHQIDELDKTPEQVEAERIAAEQAERERQEAEQAEAEAEEARLAQAKLDAIEEARLAKIAEQEAERADKETFRAIRGRHTAKPWSVYQAGPYFMDMNSAYRLWRRTATPEEISNYE